MLVVQAKVTHLGIDYATVELEAQIVDDKNPKNSRPKMEIEVPLQVGEWLAELGAVEEEN